MSAQETAELFPKLKAIMEPYAAHLTVVRDHPGDFYVDAGVHPRLGKTLFFGAVQIKKNYVSYHLMPVYVYPELLEGVSDALKKRMQGKSCFNFRRTSDLQEGSVAQELSALTRSGFERYKKDGLLP